MQSRIETLFQGPSAELSTRERILDEAIGLMSKKGYDLVTIRDIAGAVGIREGAIYNHFKSKEEILDTIIDYFLLELTRVDPGDMDLDSMLDKLGPRKYVQALTRMYMPGMSNPRMTRIWRILSIELYHNDKIKSFFRDSMLKLPIAGWERVFGRMMEKKLIKRSDPNLLAREFYSFLIYQYFVEFFLKYDGDYRSFSQESLAEWDAHVNFFMGLITV